MEYKSVDFFAPDGLEQNDEDTYRKFGGMYVLAAIKKDMKTETIEVILIHGFRKPNIEFSTIDRDSFALKRDYVRLYKAFPPLGATNWENSVLRCYKSGARQWQYGVGNQGLIVLVEKSTGSRDVEITQSVAQTLFFPSYSTVREALLSLSRKENPCFARAVGGHYWMQKMQDKCGATQFLLFRKNMPVGIFFSNDPSSFYLQSGCELFQTEINKLLEKR